MASIPECNYPVYSLLISYILYSTKFLRDKIFLHKHWVCGNNFHGSMIYVATPPPIISKPRTPSICYMYTCRDGDGCKWNVQQWPEGARLPCVKTSGYNQKYSAWSWSYPGRCRLVPTKAAKFSHTHALVVQHPSAKTMLRENLVLQMYMHGMPLFSDILTCFALL